MSGLHRNTKLAVAGGGEITIEELYHSQLKGGEIWGYSHSIKSGESTKVPLGKVKSVDSPAFVVARFSNGEGVVCDWKQRFVAQHWAEEATDTPALIYSTLDLFEQNKLYLELIRDLDWRNPGVADSLLKSKNKLRTLGSILLDLPRYARIQKHLRQHPQERSRTEKLAGFDFTAARVQVQEQAMIQETCQMFVLEMDNVGLASGVIAVFD